MRWKYGDWLFLQEFYWGQSHGEIDGVSLQLKQLNNKYTFGDMISHKQITSEFVK